LLPTCQIDKGGIPFIIGGANVMIPGMTSKGGRLPEVKADSPVAVMCEGKEHALAIGTTTMSAADMKRVNKGIGIELITYIGDDAWNSK
jgi:PUA domain protein